MQKFSVISLFSGAMGLDIGLERTGKFNLLACVEKEKPFCDTIRANREAGRLPHHLRIYEGDIKGIDPHQVLSDCGLKPGQLDVLVGGPPCQTFSTAGKRASVQDPRGTLLWDFLRFVEVMQPKFFLMENVRGLLSAAIQHRPLAQRPERGGPALVADEMPGSVVRLFAEDLHSLKCGPYHTDCFEVNAVNYGAPQLRERVIFVGNRFNVRVDFPDPTHGTSGSTTSKELLLFNDEGPDLLPWSTLRDAIGKLPDPGDVIMDFSPRKKKYLSLVPPGSNWRSLPPDLQRDSMGKAWHAKGGRSGWWRRLSFDLPCPTLVTMPNHASTSLCHPSSVRALTLKEYAAIQEFPPEWCFCGSPSQQYAQVGNAVPVRLGTVAGNVISAAMDRLRKASWKVQAGELGSYRIVYIQSHVRTRQWFKGGETFVWSDGKDNDTATYASPQTLRKVSSI